MMARMAKVVAVVLSLMLLGAGGVALAQTVQEAKVNTARTPEIIIFDGDDIKGAIHGPNQGTIVYRPAPSFRSHVRTRGDFSPEIQRSVENL